MPLSEHEERIIAEIERRLSSDDPRFVARHERRARKAGSGGHSPRRRIRAGFIGCVVGVVCVLLLFLHVAFGIAGFLLLLGSVTTIVRAWPERDVVVTREPAPGNQAPDNQHD